MGSVKSYDLTVYPIQVAVRSASDGAAVHTVTLPHCDCADFTNRRGQLIEAEGTGPSHVSVCKHIAAALERVGGWHAPAPEPKVYPEQTHVETKALLQGPEVSLSARAANSVLRRADGHVSATFTTMDGALCDGIVEYDRLTSRYKVTLRK
jgi:hypothetical protein